MLYFKHLSKSSVCCAAIAALLLANFPSLSRAQTSDERLPRVALVTTVYYHNSHADMFASRILQSNTLDYKGEYPKLKLASIYVDKQDKRDISQALAKKHKVPIFSTVAGALTLGGDKLAVDGVLLVAEHGEYAKSAAGRITYPKLRLFREVVRVFDQSERVVPMFFDKHLAANWRDAKSIYDTVQEKKIPMLAGSSLPVLWRYPPVDVKRGARLKELVATSYGPLEGYGFHALEMVQCLAERRRQGESGVESVQCLVGDEVWQAGRAGVFDRKLLEAAAGAMKERPLPKNKQLEEVIKKPVMFVIRYRDGFRASVLHSRLDYLEWTAAWRDPKDGRVKATDFWTQEWRPLMHFTYLMKGIEQLMHDGRAPWPVERTLLTTGMLDSLLISKQQGGKLLPTPQLAIKYTSDWNFEQPPPPPPNRPLKGQ